MKYSLTSESEIKRAREYFESLADKKALVEIKKLSPKRSLSQNAYLHTLLGAFGGHFGYTLAEAKILYKDVNKELYAYKKGDRIFYRSSADLSKEDMMKSIDRFREYSAEQDYPLPPATDQDWLRNIENLIEQQERYL